MDLFQKIRYRANRPSKLTSFKQLRFLNRLTRLMELGYSLIDALNALEIDKTFKSTAERVKQDLKSGHSLDEALRRERFPPLVTAFIYFAGESGDLFESIQKSSQLYEQRLAYQKTLKATSRYPIILLGVFLILIYFIKQFLLPSFTDMFQNGSNPALGTYSVLIIDLLGYGIIGFIMLLMMLALTYHIMKRKVDVQQRLTIFRFVPLYRNYLQMQTTFNFATHVSSLLASGLSIKAVFNLMSNQQQLPVLAYYSQVMIEELTKGVQPSHILSKLFFIDDNLATLFQKHVDSDTLAKDLGVYAEFLTEDIHRKVTRTISLIQPVMFIMLACFIIVTYVILMSPMLDLIKTI